MAGDATATAARVAQVLMGLYACQELVSVTMAIRRRNLQPLKFRDAILLVYLQRLLPGGGWLIQGLSLV